MIARELEDFFVPAEDYAEAFVTDLFDRAQLDPSPTIRTKPNGDLDIGLHPNSWRIELDVRTAPKGIKSARDFCGQWATLKTAAGEGCIAVWLHERTGRHVTMVIVWEHERGDRYVQINPTEHILVCVHRRGVWTTKNPGLGGWVRKSFAHAREYHPTEEERKRIPKLADAEMRGQLGYDPELEDEPTENEQRALEAAPVVIEHQDDADEGEWGDDDTASAHADPDPDRTCTPIGPVQGPESGSDEEGGGAGPTTPPLMLVAPPTSPPVSGLFAPFTVPGRPLDARPETRSGAVWDALLDRRFHTVLELAGAADLTPGSVRNLLRSWRRLGIVVEAEQGWRVVVSHHLSQVG